MKNIGHIQHLHSDETTENGIKLPNPSNLEYGEIAINYTKNNEAISIKNNNNEIASFSSDNVIMPRIESIEQAINTSNAYVGVRGYGEETPTLQTYSGTREGLNEILSHFKMGWFDGEGRLVRGCRGGCISVDVDGNDIPIDGSLKDTSGNSCDLMVYVDTDLYVDRATIDGLEVYGSSHDKQQVMGLGLKPHKVGDKEAKKFEPFGFTPHVAMYGEDTFHKPYSYYELNAIVSHEVSNLDSSTRAMRKGGGYIGLYYEFLEIWLIALYLELQTLDLGGANLFGSGWAAITPSQDGNDWFSNDVVGPTGILFVNNQKYINHTAISQLPPI